MHVCLELAHRLLYTIRGIAGKVIMPLFTEDGRANLPTDKQQCHAANARVDLCATVSPNALLHAGSMRSGTSGDRLVNTGLKACALSLALPSTSTV
jgi:hypothetical protein